MSRAKSPHHRRHRRRRTAVIIAIMATIGATTVLAANWRLLRIRFALWWNFDRAGVNEQGFDEYTHRKSGLAFIRIPGGEMLLGPREEEMAFALTEIKEQIANDPTYHPSPVYDREPDIQRAQNRCRLHAGDLRRVYIESFLIAKTEVTQEAWLSVFSTLPPGTRGEGLPVYGATWVECTEFCKRLGLSLPTREQWEYVRRLALGLREEDSVAAAEKAHAEARMVRKMTQVGLLSPDACGLHDMDGNLREFCADTWVDPSVPEGTWPSGLEKERAYVKGGGFSSWARYYLPAFCWSFPLNSRPYAVGFRPVFGLGATR